MSLRGVPRLLCKKYKNLVFYVTWSSHPFSDVFGPSSPPPPAWQGCRGKPVESPTSAAGHVPSPEKLLWPLSLLLLTLAAVGACRGFSLSTHAPLALLLLQGEPAVAHLCRRHEDGPLRRTVGGLLTQTAHLHPRTPPPCLCRALRLRLCGLPSHKCCEAPRNLPETVLPPLFFSTFLSSLSL